MLLAPSLTMNSIGRLSWPHALPLFMLVIAVSISDRNIGSPLSSPLNFFVRFPWYRLRRVALCIDTTCPRFCFHPSALFPFRLLLHYCNCCFASFLLRLLSFCESPVDYDSSCFQYGSTGLQSTLFLLPYRGVLLSYSKSYTFVVGFSLSAVLPSCSIFLQSSTLALLRSSAWARKSPWVPCIYLSRYSTFLLQLSPLALSPFPLLRARYVEQLVPCNCNWTWGALFW